MKATNYTKITSLLCLIVSLFCQTLSAQNKFIDDKFVATTVKSFVKEENQIQLRWAPLNYHTWLLGNRRGYTLRRIPIERDGQVISSQEGYNERREWKFEVADPGKFESHPNESIQLAGAAVYNPDEFKVEVLYDNPLMKAKAQEDGTLLRATMNLMATDLNVEAAELMAMYFIDTEVDPNTKYLYSVRIQELNEEEKKNMQIGYCTVSSKEVDVLPVPAIIESKGGDSTVYLKWQLDDKKWFNAFNIYKDDKKINEQPFLPNIEQPSDTILFIDKLSENKVPHVYRIEGLTSFGISSELSAPVTVEGIPAPIAAVPNIEDILVESNSSVMIKWNFNPDLVGKVQYYEIYRSNKKDGEYQLLDKVGAGETMWTDPSPMTTNYYSVVATDENDYKLASNAVAGLLEDAEPPSPPTGGSGTMDTDGSISIKWSPNTEPDLNGYQVFASNHADGEYMVVTNTVIKNTDFYYYYNPKTLSKKLYFKVAAYDFRENRSQFSAVIEVNIPDIVPPSTPVLRLVEPTVLGVNLEWVKSKSSDIAKHELQRKPIEESNWEIIQTINTTNPMASNKFLDNTGVGFETYDYRIVAFDDSGLSSPSIVHTVKNIFGSFRSDIVNTVAFEDKQLRYYYANAGSQIGASANAIPIEGFIKIYWEYPAEKGLFDFDIYRSLDNGPAILLKSVSAESAKFDATMTIPNPNNPNTNLNLGVVIKNNFNAPNLNGLIYQGTKGGYHIYLNPNNNQTVSVPVSNNNSSSGNNNSTTTTIKGGNTATGTGNSFFDLDLNHVSSNPNHHIFDDVNGSTLEIPMAMYNLKNISGSFTYSKSSNDYDYYIDKSGQTSLTVPTPSNASVVVRSVVGNITTYEDTSTGIIMNIVDKNNSSGGGKNNTPPTITGSLVTQILSGFGSTASHEEFIDKANGVVVGIPKSKFGKYVPTQLDFSKNLPTGYDEYTYNTNQTINIPTASLLKYSGFIGGYHQYYDSATDIYLIMGKNLTPANNNNGNNVKTPVNTQKLAAFMIDDDDLNTILSIKTPSQLSYQIMAKFKDGSSSRLCAPFKIK